jgi:hypothetical protein
MKTFLIVILKTNFLNFIAVSTLLCQLIISYFKLQIDWTFSTHPSSSLQDVVLFDHPPADFECLRGLKLSDFALTLSDIGWEAVDIDKFKL